MKIEIFDFPATVGQRMTKRGILMSANGFYADEFYSAGQFEVTVNAAANYAAELVKERLVRIDGHYWGIILNRRVKRGSGENSVTVTGRQLKHILSRRVTLPNNLAPQDAPAGYDALQGYSGVIAAKFAEHNFPQSGSRSVECVFATERIIGTADDKYYTRFEDLLELEEKIGRRAGIGISATADIETGAITVTAVEATNRTAEQRAVAPLILSLYNGTIDGFEFVEETEQAYNTFYCTRSGAEFEDEAFTQTYYMDGIARSGIERKEKHLNVSVGETEDTYEEMEYVARKDMESYRPTMTVSCSMTRSATPWVDYFPGDFVTFESRDDSMRANIQIEAIRKTVSGNSESVSVALGKQQFSVFDGFKRQLKNR